MPNLWDPKIAELSTLLDNLIGLGSQITPPQVTFTTQAALLADTTATDGMADNTRVRILEHDGFDLIKVSSGTVDLTAASGADFRVRMDIVRPVYFGAEGDDNGLSGSDDTAALDRALASDAAAVDLAGLRYFYNRADFAPSKPIFNGRVRDLMGEHDYRALTSDRGLPVRQALDWDEAIQSGFYWAASTADNGPGGGNTRGLVITDRGQAVQLLSRATDGALLYRQFLANEWSPWLDLTASSTRRVVDANFDDWIDFDLRADDAVNIFMVEGLLPEVNNNKLLMRLGNGSTFDAANVYRHVGTDTSTISNINFMRTGFDLAVFEPPANDPVGAFSSVRLLGASRMGPTVALTEGLAANQRFSFSAVYDAGNTAAFDTVRLLYSGGRIKSGRITHIAMKEV